MCVQLLALLLVLLAAPWQAAASGGGGPWPNETIASGSYSSSTCAVLAGKINCWGCACCACVQLKPTDAVCNRLQTQC